MNATSKRSLNLDLVRVIATFSVLSVHFFLNNGFYSQVVTGNRMYLATVMRSAFMICVPLFIILTGYLMNKKTLSLRYFINIKKVLGVYALCMIATVFYRIYQYGDAFTLKTSIYNITNYTYYAWYIEMYIGLYLLIPFINLAYNNLKTRKEKGIMIIALLCMTTAPSFFNTLIDFALIPAWWVNIYPVTYYVIGAYIAEFKDEIKISLKVNFLLIIASFLFAGTYSFIRSHNTAFVWGAWNDWYGFTNVISSVCVFLFLVRLNLDKCPPFLQKILAFLSAISLPTYLLSYIVDDYCYPIFNSLIENPLDRLFYYIPMVPITFTISSCLAIVIHLIKTILDRLFKLIPSKQNNV